ncbi:MAG: crossover junction endodeoxyribonuclease RuvC [Oligoflexia bacterium]|nr:crossover junction endodeoxyribonuclease RuvC [Oligoflexia bacterium]
MLVLGIDPGSINTGWSVVSQVAGRYRVHDARVIRTKAGQPLADRLLVIHTGLLDVIGRFQPDQVAIEAIFKHRSSESALRLGHARGVALLAAASHDLPIADYNPMTIKSTVGGHGRAGKAEIQRLVQRLVGSDRKLPQDAADATAIAITHLCHSRFSTLARMAR